MPVRKFKKLRIARNKLHLKVTASYMKNSQPTTSYNKLFASCPQLGAGSSYNRLQEKLRSCYNMLHFQQIIGTSCTLIPVCFNKLQKSHCTTSYRKPGGFMKMNSIFAIIFQNKYCQISSMQFSENTSKWLFLKVRRRDLQISFETCTVQSFFINTNVCILLTFSIMTTVKMYGITYPK